MAAGAPLTFWDAAAALAPIIGAGGISGVVIAVLGYLKAARDGRPPATVAPNGTVGIATLYAERAALEAFAEHLRGLCVEIAQLHKALATIDGTTGETLIDEVRKLRRALEDLRPGH